MKLLQAAGCSPVKVFFGVDESVIAKVVNGEQLSDQIIQQGVVWTGNYYTSTQTYFHSIDSLQEGFDYCAGPNYKPFGAHVYPIEGVKEVFTTRNAAKVYVKTLLNKYLQSKMQQIKVIMAAL